MLACLPRETAVGLWLAAALALATSGCTVIADIDVCERPRQAEQELNLRTTGDQYLGSARALSPMPSGGALAVFSSDVSGDPVDMRTEVLGTLVALDGSRQLTCGELRDMTYAPATAPYEGYELQLTALVVPPPSRDGAGVVLFARDDETSMQTMAQFIDGNGCPYGLGVEAVQISEQEGPHCDVVRSGEARPGVESTCVTSLGGALLGSPADTQFDFAVVWASAHYFESGIASRRLMARVVRAFFGRAEFLGTELSTTGEPVELVAGVNVHRLAAAGLGDGRFVVAWQELYTMTSFRTTAQLFGERLEPLSGPIALGESPGGRVEVTNVDIAVTGDRILVAWIQPDRDETMRAMARVLDRDGTPLTDALRLSANDEGAEAQVTVTALPEGRGFLVAFQESGDGSHADRSESGIRAIALGRDGEVLFANPACGRSDFQLNAATPGAQYRPSLATLEDGTIAAAWTDDGVNGVDPDGASVRAVMLRPRDLLPVE